MYYLFSDDRSREMNSIMVTSSQILFSVNSIGFSRTLTIVKQRIECTFN